MNIDQFEKFPTKDIFLHKRSLFRCMKPKQLTNTNSSVRQDFELYRIMFIYIQKCWSQKKNIVQVMIAVIRKKQEHNHHWRYVLATKKARKQSENYKNKVNTFITSSSRLYQMYKAFSQCCTGASTTYNLLEKMLSDVMKLSAQIVVRKHKSLSRQLLHLFKSIMWQCPIFEKYYFLTNPSKSQAYKQGLPKKQNCGQTGSQTCHDDQTTRMKKEMMLLHVKVQECLAKIITEIEGKIQSSFVPSKQLALWQHILNKIRIMWPQLIPKLRVLQHEKVLQKCQKNMGINEKHGDYTKGSYLGHVVRDGLDLYNQINKIKQAKEQSIKQNSTNLLPIKNQPKQINSINLYFTSLGLNRLQTNFKQIQNQEDDGVQIPLISSSSIQSQLCWTCISHFYLNQQINEELIFKRTFGEHQSYAISSTNWRKIEENQDRNSMQEILCRAINHGYSYIYIGLSQVKETSSVHFNLSSTGNQNIIKKQLLNEKFQSVASLHTTKYRVEGVQLNMKIDEHRDSVERLLKKYIDTYIFPKINLDDVEITIDYVTVLKNPWKNMEINQSIDRLKGQYVIRIHLSLINTYSELFSIETKSLNNENTSKSIYTFFGEQPSEQSLQMRAKTKQKYENVLFGSDIYQQMLNKFNSRSEQWETYTARHGHYPIECVPPLRIIQHGHIEQGIQMKAKGVQSQIDEYYVLKKEPTMVKVIKQENCNQHLQPQSIQQITSSQIYGFQPALDKGVGYHHSLVITSPTGIKKGLLEQFKKQLNTGKYAYKLYENVYENLPRASVRTVHYMTHQKKSDVFNKIAKSSVDNQKRNLLVMGITSQFELISSDNFAKAISLLGLRFKQMFNCNYTLALADRQTPDNKIKTEYYFQFQNDCQSIFAFVLLEYQNIRCDFVKASALDGLKMYKY